MRIPMIYTLTTTFKTIAWSTAHCDNCKQIEVVRRDQFSTWEWAMFMVPFYKHPVANCDRCDVCGSVITGIEDSQQWVDVEQWEPSEKELPAFHQLVNPGVSLGERDCSSEARCKSLLGMLKSRLKADREIPQGNPHFQNIAKFMTRDYFNYGILLWIGLLVGVFGAMFTNIALKAVFGDGPGMDNTMATSVVIGMTIPAALGIYFILARKKEILTIAPRDKCRRYLIDPNALVKVANTSFQKKIANKIQSSLASDPTLHSTDRVTSANRIEDLTPFQGRSYAFLGNKIVRFAVGLVIAFVVGGILAWLYQLLLAPKQEFL